MTPSPRRRPISSPSNARWAAYAAAGAATAIAGVQSAEADIHYSGILNRKVVNEDATFPLDGGAVMAFHQNVGSEKHGFASMKIAADGAFAANRVDPDGFLYFSNLARGVNLSEKILRKSCTVTYTSSRYVCYGAIIGAASPGYGYFREPGVGSIGFSFDRGAGVQYGWARIKITGDPDYRFIVKDYAYADPGEPIRTGQTSSAPRQANAIPDSGSLGLLALGGVGLVAWRRRHSEAAQVK
jgi:hypothetical protein